MEKLTVYLDYVILGQLIPAMNSPENITNMNAYQMRYRW